MTLQIMIHIEDVDDELGTTRGWIVPTGTDPTADLQLEAVDHVDIPAHSDEAEWFQGLRDELAAAGYALVGYIVADATTVTAEVVRA